MSSLQDHGSSAAQAVAVQTPALPPPARSLGAALLSAALHAGFLAWIAQGSLVAPQPGTGAALDVQLVRSLSAGPSIARGGSPSDSADPGAPAKATRRRLRVSPDASPRVRRARVNRAAELPSPSPAALPQVAALTAPPQPEPERTPESEPPIEPIQASANPAFGAVAVPRAAAQTADARPPAEGTVDAGSADAPNASGSGGEVGSGDAANGGARGSFARDALALYQPEPEYPKSALAAGREGSVEVEFTIQRDGTPYLIHVTTADPPGIFDQAALRAVEKWKYAPPTIDGTVVERPDVRVTIEFKLKGRRPPSTRF